MVPCRSEVKETRLARFTPLRLLRELGIGYSEENGANSSDGARPQ